jgi:hypothetical protein
MPDTSNLALPYIEAAQAQKHVTHNEALRVLDVIVQLSVIDRDLMAPPGDPADGDRYLVADGGTGNWAGKDLQVAAWQDGGWVFHLPRPGWLCWIADENLLVAWDGEGWIEVGAVMGTLSGPETLGINALANETNRLAVASEAVLFNHDGSGHQLKINKNEDTDTASLLYQTGFSGRAEMGLTGDDDYHFKVSADGETWSEAIVIDRTTGEVSFPNTSISGGGGGGSEPAGLGVGLFWSAN